MAHVFNQLFKKGPTCDLIRASLAKDGVANPGVNAAVVATFEQAANIIINDIARTVTTVLEATTRSKSITINTDKTAHKELVNQSPIVSAILRYHKSCDQSKISPKTITTMLNMSSMNAVIVGATPVPLKMPPSTRKYIALLIVTYIDILIDDTVAYMATKGASHMKPAHINAIIANGENCADDVFTRNLHAQVFSGPVPRK